MIIACWFDADEMIWVLRKKSIKLQVISHFVINDELLALPIRKLCKNVIFYFRYIDCQI